MIWGAWMGTSGGLWDDGPSGVGGFNCLQFKPQPGKHPWECFSVALDHGPHYCSRLPHPDGALRAAKHFPVFCYPPDALKVSMDQFYGQEIESGENMPHLRGHGACEYSPPFWMAR